MISFFKREVCVMNLYIWLKDSCNRKVENGASLLSNSSMLSMKVKVSGGDRTVVTAVRDERVGTEETAEINDEDAIVSGFRSNIRLMPHQVVARK